MNINRVLIGDRPKTKENTKEKIKGSEMMINGGNLINQQKQ